MPELAYGIYTLISRPRLNERLGLWIAHGSVVWQENGWSNLHRFPDIGTPFISEQDALDFGVATARAWIDERVGSTNG